VQLCLGAVAGGKEVAAVDHGTGEGAVVERTCAQHLLHGIIDLLKVSGPQLHAKFLAWDKHNVVVTSMNWGSQSGSPDDRLNEIGLYLSGPDLATIFVKKFEAHLEIETPSLAS
jgi:phosphatidylserine/phosphatidylglycerophosphate/cardiolipin synthase-like enzyme